MTPLPGKGGYGSPAGAVRMGMRHCMGVPALVLGATYVGFGSLVRQSGLDLIHGLFSTATGWAIPGQIALVELYAAGATLFAITAAVALTNARLLPMTLALMPHIRAPGQERWKLFLLSHYVAVTGWAQAMRICPHLPQDQRLSYFGGFAVTLWTITLFATALGFFLAGVLPAYITLGLVFLNPIYFMLVFVSDLRQRAWAYALVLGAIAGPLLHLITPDWGLLLTGVVAGTAGYAADKFLKHRASKLSGG